ncbi:hypothetical protein HELRODRAFT_174469 [Helobdella robusta]|uniref:Uncharacterized protein n=1 Tax=Helobdella robusta TaxID=6412 RepID=T1F856_HELRO|nr:hypothetical protein HELRODRAFT_174469 [Helobdella robusta]ESO01513.1 hypothetical protein HELRODRAFT_174469 [Helobdella robusta]
MSSINMNVVEIENAQNLKNELLDDSQFETNVNYFENRRNMSIYKGKRFKKRYNAVSNKIESSNNAEKILSNHKINVSPTNLDEHLSINTSVWSSESIDHINFNDDSDSSFISIYPIYFNDCSARPLAFEDTMNTRPTNIHEDEESLIYCISHHNNCPAHSAQSRRCCIKDNSDHEALPDIERTNRSVEPFTAKNQSSTEPVFRLKPLCMKIAIPLKKNQRN